MCDIFTKRIAKGARWCCRMSKARKFFHSDTEYFLVSYIEAILNACSW